MISRIPAGTAVAGLAAATILAVGSTLLVEHATSGSPVALSAAAVAAASPSPSSPPAQGRHPGFAAGHGGFAMGLGGMGAGGLLELISKDTGLSRQQILTDVRNGQTLDQIAGSKQDQVRADALAAVTKVLDAAVSRGVITKDSEQHLIADAKDAIDQLMGAKLGNAGFGLMPGHPGRPGVPPSPSATPAV